MAFVAMLLAGGCGGGEEAPSPTTTARAPLRVAEEIAVKDDRWSYARARFNEMCAGCHTLAAARATGPRFNLDRSSGVNEVHVRFAIREGEPGMPAFGDVLSRREYEELVAFVLAVAEREPGETNWGWQHNLRTEGDAWKPEDGR